MIRRYAFTMAEILIVMALIGFLFTLMIPTVMQKQTSTKFIEKAQKAQSSLQEAFRKASEANNDLYPMDWESVRESENKSDAIIKEIAKKTSVMSFCGNKIQGCFSTGEYKTLNGVPTTIIQDEISENDRLREEDDYIASIKTKSYDEYGFEEVKLKKLKYTKAKPQFSSSYISLLDGGAVALKTNSSFCDGIVDSTDNFDRPLCGVIYVDVNGQSIPNMLGVDVFGFYLSGNDILPMGFYGDDFAFEYNCLRETPKTRNNNGLACTAWVLKNNNMDYRKCQAGKRLNWIGATRCDMPKNNNPNRPIKK